MTMDGVFRQQTEKVSGIADLLKLDNDSFAKRVSEEKLCRQILDHIIVLKRIVMDDDDREMSEYKIIVDPKTQPMKEVIQAIKHQKYLRQIDEKSIIANELQEAKSLGITLNVLADCTKNTQVTVINKQVFKVSCYFVNNLKNLKLTPMQERFFDW